MKRLALALLALLFATVALAQNVTVIGPVTPGNVPVFNSTTVIKDSGQTPGGAATVFNVKQAPCNAKGDGSTDDTAAINTCIGLFNTATNGRLYFPASSGCYKTTAALTTITANGIIQGDGPTMLTGQFISSPVTPASQICNTTTNASVFTVRSQQAMIRDLSINNTAGSTPTTGSAGITVTHPTEWANKVDMENLTVVGFNIDIDRQDGQLWVMHNIMIIDPVLYGLKIANVNNHDAGDWNIDGITFQTITHNSTDAMRIESSGGGKIVNIKVNCNGPGCSASYTNGIEIFANSDTADLAISNGSFENYAVSGTGTGILLDNGNWPNITISNVQFNPFSGNGTGIGLSNSFKVTIDGVICHVNPCVGLTNMQDVNVSNLVGSVVNNAPIAPSTLFGATSLQEVHANGGSALFQGYLTQGNYAPTVNSMSDWVLGTPFLGGGTPAATNHIGFLGSTNGWFTGGAQKDWMSEIEGGGQWWLLFNADPEGGGTRTMGLNIHPISAGGPTLMQVLSGSTASPPVAGGWIQSASQQRVTADVPFTSTTTPALVTGLQETVFAGRNYSFDAYLSWTDAAAGGIQCTVNGTATATAIRYDGWIVDSAANGIKGNAAATALGGVVASATTTGTNGVVQIKGTMTVNAGGTMEVRCAQNTSNGTATTIKQGSYWIVQDMP